MDKRSGGEVLGAIVRNRVGRPQMMTRPRGLLDRCSQRAKCWVRPRAAGLLYLVKRVDSARTG